MTSPVNWALLGLVIDRPSYGLELAHRFERTYSDVLPVSSESHIYAALDALEARSMIEVVPAKSIGRQPKPHYRATPAGVSAYRQWLVEQVGEERRRSELWVRQLAIFLDDPNMAVSVIERYERECMKGATDATRPREDSGVDSGSELIDQLVAMQNRIAVGAMLSWIQYAHRTFEALAEESKGYDAARA